MDALTHVANAIRHAEGLSDEAEDLGLPGLAQRLARMAAAITVSLDAALHAQEQVAPAREARSVARATLACIYADATCRLDTVLPAAQATRLNPGGQLDVAERTRFRLRQLPPEERKEVRTIRESLERGLADFDAAIDRYLIACAEEHATRDQTVMDAQAGRHKLSQAKCYLLTRAAPESAAWRRIKSRCVRTKRARWIHEDDTIKQQLTLTLSDEPVCSVA